MTDVDAFVIIAGFVLVPALVIAALVALIAKVTGKNAGKAFVVSLLIVVGVVIIGWGLCVVATQNIG